MTPRYRIRDYRPADALQIRALFRETHLAASSNLPPRSQELIRQAAQWEITNRLSDVGRTYAAAPNRFFAACETDNPDQVAGYCAAVHRTDAVVEFKNLVVSPAHQGAGVGRLLMDALERYVTDAAYQVARFWTYRHLRVAYEMYQRRGYVEDELEPYEAMLPELEPVAMSLNLATRRRD